MRIITALVIRTDVNIALTLLCCEPLIMWFVMYNQASDCTEIANSTAAAIAYSSHDLPVNVMNIQSGPKTWHFTFVHIFASY